jgi:hypothetical protein
MLRASEAPFYASEAARARRCTHLVSELQRPHALLQLQSLLHLLALVRLQRGPVLGAVQKLLEARLLRDGCR